jgi:hypothetical protein
MIGTTALTTVTGAVASTVTPGKLSVEEISEAFSATSAFAAVVTAAAMVVLLLLLAAAFGIVRVTATLTLAAERRIVSKQSGAWQPSVRRRLALRSACCDAPKKDMSPATVSPSSTTVAGLRQHASARGVVRREGRGAGSSVGHPEGVR